MSDNLDELEALARAATPGPWRNGTDTEHFDAPEVTDGKTFAYWVTKDGDAAFIAAASPDHVLALIDRLRRAEAERDAARAALTEACDIAAFYCGDGTDPEVPEKFQGHAWRIRKLRELATGMAPVIDPAHVEVLRGMLHVLEENADAKKACADTEDVQWKADALLDVIGKMKAEIAALRAVLGGVP